MKKILIALAALLVLAAGAVAIFIATFDLNRYRPMIVQKAAEAVGAPVDIGRLSLVWRNGIAARIDGLVVYADPQKKASSIKVREISASVRFLPLLSKSIEISSIVVQDPAVHLVKNADGKVQISGVKMPSAPGGGAAGTAPSADGALPLLSVDSFRMRGGQVVFDDRTRTPPLRISVKQVDVDVKDFSLSEPFDVNAKAAVFSAAQNIRLSGRVALPSGSKAGAVEDLRIQTDLADLNRSDLAKIAPALESAGIQDLQGRFDVEVARMALDPQGLGTAKADVELHKGLVKLGAVRSVLENVSLSASVDRGDLRIGNFSADFAGGTLKAKGVVKQFSTRPQFGLTWVSKDLSIDQLASRSSAASRLSGKLSVDFEGQGAGTAWPELSQTLVGQGVVELRDGVLMDTNLLRTVIDKLSVIPGAGDMIRRSLPPQVVAKLNEPSTILKPTKIPFAVQGGFMTLNAFELATDYLAIRGAGQMRLADKALSARAAVLLDPGLSQTIAGAVPQIQLLLNPQGQIEIPTQIQGQVPHLMILPDTEFIAQKLIASQLTGFIQNPEQSISKVRNLLDKPVDAGQSGVEKSVAGLLGSEDGLKNLFKQALSGEEPTQQAAASGTEIPVQ